MINSGKNRVEFSEKLSDAELVRKVLSGDVPAFQVLFNRYSKQLLDFAFSYLRDTQECEDIVQDVFVSIWNKRRALNPELSIKAYLYKSVLNRALQSVRHKNVVRSSMEITNPSEEYDRTPYDDLSEKEIDSAIHCAIGELPEKCREIFSLNRFDGLTYAEIAEILDISLNTVKTQMGRALKFLRKRLSHFLSIFFL